MKTVEDLNRLIRDEIAAIEALRSEDEKIWSVRGGVTEGVRMMLDQLRGQVERIAASADRYKLKEQKKEYLTRAGAQLKHTQIAELEFLLQ